MNHKYLESDLKVGELDARWDNTSSPGLKITPSPLPLNKSSAQIPRFCHDPMTLPLLLLTSHLPFLPFCTSVVCESPLPLYYHYWLFMLFLLRIWFFTTGHGWHLLIVQDSDITHCGRCPSYVLHCLECHLQALAGCLVIISVLVASLDRSFVKAETRSCWYLCPWCTAL